MAPDGCVLRRRLPFCVAPKLGTPAFSAANPNPNPNPNSNPTQARLLSFAELGFPMGASCPKSARGLIGSHAYSLLEVRQLTLTLTLTLTPTLTLALALTLTLTRCDSSAASESASSSS